MNRLYLHNNYGNELASKPARGYHKEHQPGRRDLEQHTYPEGKGKIKQEYAGIAQWVPGVIDVSIIVVLHLNRWLRDRIFRQKR